MALVQGLFALVSRQAGKLLNTAFGWATMLLFGKVQKDRQLTLSVICLGSVVWIVVTLSVAFPRLGTFLLTFVPVPDWVDDSYIRLVMLVAALIVPAIVGLLSLRLATEENKDSAIKTILRGYPTTLALALTLIMLTVFAPILQLRVIARRWTTAHVPVMVEPPEYLEVVGQLERALGADGVNTRRERASWLVRFPTKILTLLAGRFVSGLVADQLTVLHADQLEVMLHPADLVISGKEETVSRARATVAETLTFSDANLTWTKEAMELEDRVRALWRNLHARRDGFSLQSAVQELKAVDQDVRAAKLPYEEWEVLNRAVAQADRTLLAMATGKLDRPTDLIESSDRIAAARVVPAPPSPAERVRARTAKLAGLLFLVWLGRKRPEGRQILSVGNVVNMARAAVR